jgi:hypothetical protein
MNESDYPALKTEIETDPKTLGYAGKTSQEVADLLNEVGLSDETISRGLLPTSEIMECFVAGEMGAITSSEFSMLQLVCNREQLDMGNANIQGIFTSIFAGGTDTRNNLIAKATMDASRAEALFGKDTVVYSWDVERALAL